MEYPFKDSLPLDEVLERKGYYRDWTHIDANTFHQISELFKFIREKGYGTDTREAIAQALERVYHDATMSGNANMEVSMARKHFKDLATRLDASDADMRNISVDWINKNLGKLDQSFMSDDFLQQIAGNAPINSVPADRSVTTEKLATRAVEPFNTSFFERNSENMIDPSTFVDGYVDINGNVGATTESKVSPFISVKPNTAYRVQAREPVSGKTVYIAGYTDNQVFTRRFAPMTIFNDSVKNWILTNETETKIRLSANVELVEDLYLHEGDDLREFPQEYFFDTQYLPTTPTLNYNEQTDFVELLKLHNESNLPLKARMTGDRSFWVYQPIANGKYIGHNFTKDTNDDFFIYASAVLCSINTENNVVNERYMMAGSNKEFAFFIKPNAAATPYWNPDHGTGTTFKISQSIKFDGVEKIDVVTNESMQEVNVVTIRQEMNLTYPNDPTPVGKLIIVMTVNKNGVSYNGHVEWLKPFIVDRGYVNMLPISDSPVDTLRTSLGYEYDVTAFKANESIEDGDETLSYAFLNKNLEGVNNLVLAQTVINPTQSYRVGEQGRYEPNPIWVEHRTAKVHKLYPQIYNNHTVKSGDKTSWGAQIYVGILENAGELLI